MWRLDRVLRCDLAFPIFGLYIITYKCFKPLYIFIFSRPAPYNIYYLQKNNDPLAFFKLLVRILIYT
jgi:hypothetical protein